MNPINEVQLTAYALGEGFPEERRQIEEQLRDHPEQQAEIDAIRALAANLEAELAREPDIALTPAQRQAILDAPAKTAGRLARFPLRKITGFAAVAAVVTLVFGGAFWSASRSLHKTLLAQIDEKGEMAVGMDHLDLEQAMLDKLLDDIQPPEELAEYIEATPAPAEAPLPPVQEFAAAPAANQIVHLEMAASTVPSLVVRKAIMAESSPTWLSSTAYESRPNGYYANTANRPAQASKNAIRVMVDGCTIPSPFDEKVSPETAESYAPFAANPFRSVLDEPLSTFSIDVDTAAYANVRRFLKAGQLPPADAVRIESAACPWAPAHALVKIALKGRELAAESRPPCNLVFLIDVSGSMNHPNKLPLVKKSLQLLARQLTDNDRVSIVVYASSSGLVLPPTPASDLAAIDAALERLQAGGSTAGGAGIRLAYDEAKKSFLPGGNNRVILCTDGDFNVGITDSAELAAFIADRARQGIFLTILGFGMGNYKDDRLETLSNQGNGNYAYIDSFSEARKSLVEQAAGTLFAIAKDVKLQIEFSPAHFTSYRLVGYENRLLAKEDFNDDRKDAGELGAGHVVTAFYELVPVGVESTPGVDPLKYQATPDHPAPPAVPADASPEWLTVKLRYKRPDQDTSSKIEVPYTGSLRPFNDASADFRFAAGVAAAGYLLRHDPGVNSIGFPQVIDWTAAATDPDPDGYRREFIDLMKNAAVLAPQAP